MKEEEIIKKKLHNLFLKRNKELHTKITNGIKQDEFFLVYQPKIELKTKKIIGMEALLRWQHNNKIIPPLEFINYAEQAGLINRLTYTVLQKGFKQIKEWTEQKLDFNTVAFNIPATTLVKDKQFLPTVKKLIKHYKINPNQVVFEILEHAVVKDFAIAAAIIKKLRKMGIKIAIDDFGTGYSSLSYLKGDLQSDNVKLDKIFVDNLHIKKEEEFFYHLANFITNLNLSITVEGVETSQQVAILQNTGITLQVQGYYFFKPMPANQITKILK